jgi:hypothetical protein
MSGFIVMLPGIWKSNFMIDVFKNENEKENEGKQNEKQN